jgi:uncharacterized protein (TIGR02301 family)
MRFAFPLSRVRLIHAAVLAAAASLALAAAPAAGAQEVTAPEPAPAAPSGPSVAALTDLAAILGEAHAVRSACNGEGDQTWRNYMLDLLDFEAPGGARRSSMTSAFNRGYRAQRGRMDGCTPDAPQLEAAIAARGRQLSDAIAQTYLD